MQPPRRPIPLLERRRQPREHERPNRKARKDFRRKVNPNQRVRRSDEYEVVHLVGFNLFGYAIAELLLNDFQKMIITPASSPSASVQFEELNQKLFVTQRKLDLIELLYSIHSQEYVCFSTKLGNHSYQCPAQLNCLFRTKPSFNLEMFSLKIVLFVLLCLLVVPPSESCWAGFLRLFSKGEEEDHFQNVSHTCQDIQQRSPDAELIMVAFTPTRFMLITKGMSLVEIPIKDLAADGELNKEILLNGDSKPMAQSHPHIPSSKYMEDIKGKEITALTLFDPDGEYLCITVKQHASAEESNGTAIPGMIVDLGKNEVHPGLQLWDREEEVFLSSDEDALTYFAIRHVDSKVEVAKYQLAIEPMSVYVEVAAKNETHNDEQRHKMIMLDGNWTQICKGAKEDELVFAALAKEGSNCTSIGWTIKHGLVHKAHFILFEDKDVLMFSMVAFANLGESTHFDRIPFDQFFKCSDGHNSSTEETKNGEEEEKQKLSVGVVGNFVSRKFLFDFARCKLIFFLPTTKGVLWIGFCLVVALVGVLGYSYYSKRQKARSRRSSKSGRKSTKSNKTSTSTAAVVSTSKTSTTSIAPPPPPATTATSGTATATATSAPAKSKSKASQRSNRKSKSSTKKSKSKSKSSKK